MGASPEPVAAISTEATSTSVSGNTTVSTSASGNSEEIRTIFVLGFPGDVKEREFVSLLKWWPGYEACMMDFKGEQPLGFARFKTAALARAARDMIQNVVLEREGKSRMTLRAEMARKNLYLRPSNGRHNGSWSRSLSGTQSPPSPTAPQQAQLYSPHSLGFPAANSANSSINSTLVSGGYAQMMTPWFFPSMQWNPQHVSVNGTGYAHHAPMLQSPVRFGYQLGGQVPAQHQVAFLGAAPGTRFPSMICAPMQQNSKDHPPCNTLFIGNLGMGTSEWEIRTFFSSFPGFRQLKILRSVHGTTCFVEFLDIPSAASVHQSMQGAVLSSSNRGGMRIQFSKNPYGCRGDGGKSNTGGAFQFDRGTARSRGGDPVVVSGSDRANGEIEENGGSTLTSTGVSETVDTQGVGKPVQLEETTLSEDWQEVMNPEEEFHSPHESIEGYGESCGLGSE